MDINKHSDLIKTLLSTVAFVFGAIGSIFNFIKGHNIPMILSIAAVLIAGLIVYAEWRRMQTPQVPVSPPQPTSPIAVVPAPLSQDLTARSIESCPSNSRALRITNPQKGQWFIEDERVVVRLVGPR